MEDTDLSRVPDTEETDRQTVGPTDGKIELYSYITSWSLNLFLKQQWPPSCEHAFTEVCPVLQGYKHTHFTSAAHTHRGRGGRSQQEGLRERGKNKSMWKRETDRQLNDRERVWENERAREREGQINNMGFL